MSFTHNETFPHNNEWQLHTTIVFKKIFSFPYTVLLYNPHMSQTA